MRRTVSFQDYVGSGTILRLGNCWMRQMSTSSRLHRSGFVPFHTGVSKHFSSTMEQNSFPTAAVGNRDAFRRSLQNSLSDVLSYLGGGLEPTARAPQPFDVPPRSTSSILHRSPEIAASTPSSLLMQTLGITHSSMAHRSSPLFSSQLECQLNHEVMLKQAAEKRFAQAALLQRMAMERRQESLRDVLLLRLLQSRRPESQPEMPMIDTTGQLVNAGQDSVLATATSICASAPKVSLDNSEEMKAQKRKQNAYTLHALGNHLRSRHDPYIDCLDIEDPNETMETTTAKHRRSRGGVSSHFPELLHRMLIDVEDNNETEVVSFFSHGRAFCVHDMDRFVNDIMPKYFKQSKWSSFARQLNLYGFIRIANGPDSGGYYHELFLRSRPTLCLHMRRVGVPQAQQDRRKCRPKHVAELQEPDFYSMQKSLRAASVE